MITTSEKIQQQIKDNTIILYMKGSPKSPKCGFSAQVVEILNSYGKYFAYIDVLVNPDIRKELPKFAKWPTYPQLWINGKLIGGCEIIIEMHQQGKIQKLITNITEKM